MVTACSLRQQARQDVLSCVSLTLEVPVVADLNSLADSPRLRASFGSLAAPNRSMMIKSTMMSSVGPRLNVKPFGRKVRCAAWGLPGGTPTYDWIG